MRIGKTHEERLKIGKQKEINKILPRYGFAVFPIRLLDGTYLWLEWYLSLVSIYTYYDDPRPFNHRKFFGKWVPVRHRFRLKGMNIKERDRLRSNYDIPYLIKKGLLPDKWVKFFS